MTKTTLATVATRQKAMSTWHVVDASGRTLGRMATEIATVLMGKHRPDYTPYMLVGEGVVVVNADKVTVTGEKGENREYTYYTGYPGGLRHVKLADYLSKAPEELIRLSVRRMLPKSMLGAKMLSRLKVYRGEAHPHAAQKPQALKGRSAKKG
jgi:large subunit ribosomal protein L13